ECSLRKVIFPVKLSPWMMSPVILLWREMRRTKARTRTRTKQRWTRRRSRHQKQTHMSRGIRRRGCWRRKNRCRGSMLEVREMSY
ncbi:hypothetical protein KEM56_006199, partial [Ascosphaera pollenicola]